MKSYIKLAAAVIAILAVIFAGANIILHYENKGDAGRPYRVEAERIAAKIESGEEYSLDDYRYIKNIEIQEDVFQGGDSDYLVKEIGGRLYRFDYSYQADNTAAITAFNICFGAGCVLIDAFSRLSTTGNDCMEQPLQGTLAFHRLHSRLCFHIDRPAILASHLEAQLNADGLVLPSDAQVARLGVQPGMLRIL